MMLQQKLYWFLFFFSLLGFGQEKVTLSGVISDANNNETLIGVSVYVSELNIGTYTNNTASILLLYLKEITRFKLAILDLKPFQKN